MSLTASYYVSTINAGTRDGSFGNPYLLSDLSIVGGSTKTVAANDVIALKADGTYVLPANLNLPAGSGQGRRTILRGCKTDGSWDETRATRAVISGAGLYRFNQTNGYAAYADLAPTNPPSSGCYTTGASAYYGHLCYNVAASKGTGHATAPGFAPASGTEAWMIACTADGLGGYGFIRGSYLYCVARDCGRGFFPEQAGMGGLVAHCIGFRSINEQFNLPAGALALHCTAEDGTADGFVCPSTLTGGQSLVGCLATNNGGYGFVLTSNGSTNRPMTVVRCGTYGNTSGSYSVPYGLALTEIDITNIDPQYVSASDLTPQESGVPSLSAVLGAAPGGNLAGALCGLGAGSGGGGLFTHPGMAGGMRG